MGDETVCHRGLGVDCGQLRLCVRYAGFGLCVAWGFLLFSVVEFHPGSNFGVFAWSGVPGLIACLALFLTSWRASLSGRRSGFAFCSAALASIGTFLHVSPLWLGTWVQYVGLALAGVSFIGLLASWFVSYARLSARGVFLASGFALLLASLVCTAVSALDFESAGLAVSLLPIAAALFLPKVGSGPLPEPDDCDRSALQVVKAAIPLKTMLGLLLVYYVIDSLRGLGRLPGSFLGIADVTFLVFPVCVSCVCVLVSCCARSRIDLGVLCKVVLAAFSVSLAFIVIAVHPGYRFGFATSVCTQVLCWMLLVFTAKKSPVRAEVVFALGWIVEFAGGFLAQVLTPLAYPLGTVVPFALALLMAAATVFIFSDESLVVDIDCDDSCVDDDAASLQSLSTNEPLVLAPTADSSSEAGLSCRIAAFSERYALTPRESEVFALWITGHGMKAIQEELFVSQGTVKTHLRNIYDKCDVHSRRDLMKMFEE